MTFSCPDTSFSIIRNYRNVILLRLHGFNFYPFFPSWQICQHKKVRNVNATKMGAQLLIIGIRVSYNYISMIIDYKQAKCLLSLWKVSTQECKFDVLSSI